VINKTLEYDEREKNDSKVTLHKLQALLKDGLAIPNIKIRKVSRKNEKESLDVTLKHSCLNG
jgi:hypothetical protein